MLTLTWFGFLPSGTSRNIYENQEASDGEQKIFCRPDLEKVHRSSWLEGMAFKDLYFVRRVGYLGLDQDFTWIAKCESIKSRTQDRGGAYRGAGLMLSGTTISGNVAQTLVDVVFDCMTQYVPPVLPRGFNLAAAVSSALGQRKVQDLINAVHSTVLKDASPLQDGTGLCLANGEFAVGIVDISNLHPDHRSDTVARFLENAQTNRHYHRFGEIYISAEPNVIAAALRIPNARIIPLDWDPQPKKAAASVPPQQPAISDVEEDEEMSDQKLQQLRDRLLEKMRDEAAEQADLQVRALEKRLTQKIEGITKRPSQGLEWSRVVGWVAAAAAVIAISVSASVYLALRNGGGEPADMGKAIEAALKPVNEAVTGIDARLKTLEGKVDAIHHAPAQASLVTTQRLSENSTKAAQLFIAKVQTAAAELEATVIKSQDPLKTEVKRISDILRQSVPSLCRQFQMTAEECKPATPSAPTTR